MISVFKHQDLQMFGVKLNKYRQMEIQLIGQKIVVIF